MEACWYPLYLPVRLSNRFFRALKAVDIDSNPKPMSDYFVQACDFIYPRFDYSCPLDPRLIRHPWLHPRHG